MAGAEYRRYFALGRGVLDHSTMRKERRVRRATTTTLALNYQLDQCCKEGDMEAMVVAVGNGKIQENGSLRKLEVKAGDKILFSKYSGNEIKIDGTDHLILREDDILAVLE